MPSLKLKHGLFLFDEEDEELVYSFAWYSMKQPKCNVAYVVCSSYLRRNTMRFHRFILGLEDSSIYVDHINRNGLDNRRLNLRVCIKRQNHFNSTLNSNNTSGFKGVRFNTSSHSWQARIGNKHIGCFCTPEDASEAYDAEALRLYKDFARTNQMIREEG